MLHLFDVPADINISQSREYFMVGKIEQVVPNPFAGAVTDLNISTIGLTMPDMYGDWPVIQEYRGSSFLAGLSTAGGLGSLLSTLLAMFLGTSLVHMVIRELSPFRVHYCAFLLTKSRRTVH